MQSRIQDYTHQLIRDQMREYFETHIQKKILSKSPEPQDMVFPHQVRKLMIPRYFDTYNNLAMLGQAKGMQT